jgi:hypothetical protein
MALARRYPRYRGSCSFDRSYSKQLKNLAKNLVFVGKLTKLSLKLNIFEQRASILERRVDEVLDASGHSRVDQVFALLKLFDRV